MASKIRLYDICWNSQGEDIDHLPEEIIISDLPEEDVQKFYGDNEDEGTYVAIKLHTWLYDHYGFSAESFGGEVILEDTL